MLYTSGIFQLALGLMSSSLELMVVRVKWSCFPHKQFYIKAYRIKDSREKKLLSVEMSGQYEMQTVHWASKECGIRVISENNGQK
jgi:hypothetical protein